MRKVKTENEIKLAELRKARKAEVERNKKLFLTYCDMEGMYATRKVNTDYCGMHDRGYTYEYAFSMKEKENAERKKFLIDNNYVNSCDYKYYAEKFDNEIERLENEICIEKYGYDLKEKKRLKDIAYYEKAKIECEKELAKINAKLESLKK